MKKLILFTLTILFAYNCAITANTGKMTVTETAAKREKISYIYRKITCILDFSLFTCVQITMSQIIGL